MQDKEDRGRTFWQYGHHAAWSRYSLILMEDSGWPKVRLRAAALVGPSATSGSAQKSTPCWAILSLTMPSSCSHEGAVSEK